MSTDESMAYGGFLARLRLGDEAAITRLVADYQMKFKAVLTGKLGEASAEDALQDIFKYPHQFEARGICIRHSAPRLFYFSFEANLNLKPANRLGFRTGIFVGRNRYLSYFCLKVSSHFKRYYRLISYNNAKKTH